ncbi:hypothetical protein K469DRAFT_638799 [Zopfia rhizophila CBS 207.26]|uniref:Uncharacterized protein n=1 Tax=Zopfia rhizophila CBS 207.26 TaxID=1314779 RepID=A0A6A6DNM9_9PEZI|nr:hypothetical protein K469DRAFT_638799 [Zopfia rhizophila CBS 207.26]
MADPVSISGLLIAIAQAIAAIRSYGSTVKDAKDDIKSLSEELFALKGLLEHLSAHNSEELSDIIRPRQYDKQQLASVIESATSFITHLSRKLERPQDRTGRIAQTLKWPLKKDEVDKHIDRLSRVKSWLTLVLMTDNFELTKDLYAEVQALSTALRSSESLQRERFHLTDGKLLRYYSPVMPFERHNQALEAHLPGTGDWFVQGPLKDLINYASLDNMVLWLNGRSGMGKSTLFSLAVECTCSSPGIDKEFGFAYFYCSFDDASTQKPRNLLGSIAAQLAQIHPEILDELEFDLKRRRPNLYNTEPTIQELEAVIVRASSYFQRIFLFIDAVNESQYSDDILLSICTLLNSSTNLRFLLTSVSDVSDLIQSSGVHTMEVYMDSRIVGQDIEMVIDARLAGDRNLRGLRPQLKKEIREVVKSRADGMFRYVQLTLDQLSSCRTGRSIRSELDAVPTNLNAAYAGMLSRIVLSADRELVKETLMWLSFAMRPLSLFELSEAVAFAESDSDIDADSRLHQPAVLVELCQGLINNRDLDGLSLAHASVKSFLTSHWIANSSVSEFALDTVIDHKAIMRKCLAYLSMQPLATAALKAADNIWTLFSEYPLLRYAAHNWAHHATACSSLDGEDHARIFGFFDTRHESNGGSYRMWLQALLQNCDLSFACETHPLYYSASFGLTTVVRAILKAQPDIKIDQSGGRRGSSALIVASYRGHYDTVRVLLEAGANPEYEDEDSTTAIDWAKCRGFQDIEQLLRTYQKARQASRSATFA